VVIVAVTQSAGWPEVKRTFFDWGDISSSFPDIARAFVLNVKIFLVCEVFILVFALVIAVLRSLPGPCSSRCARSRSSTPTSPAACRRSS
jgi:polar amino acid transport system permease protein